MCAGPKWPHTKEIYGGASKNSLMLAQSAASLLFILMHSLFRQCKMKYLYHGE